MVDIGHVISQVQTDINDISGERIPRASYIDWLKEVGFEIGMDSHAYIGRYSTVPNPSSAPSNTPIHTVTIPYEENGIRYSPYKIIRVARSDGDNFYETREFSKQAVGAKNSANSPFGINYVDLTRNNYAILSQDNNNSQNGAMTLVFGESFDLDDMLVVDFIQSDPIEIKRWETPIDLQIPSYMYHSYYYGLKFKCIGRLYDMGDQTRYYPHVNAKKSFEEHKNKLAAYIRNIKDVNSTVVPQPIIWLDE